jgi:hypothetical protein
MASAAKGKKVTFDPMREDLAVPISQFNSVNYFPTV